MISHNGIMTYVVRQKGAMEAAEVGESKRSDESILRGTSRGADTGSGMYERTLMRVSRLTQPLSI